VGFKGHLRLVGIDVSVAAAAMARFVVAVSARDWSPQGGISIEILVGDSLGEPGIPQADVVVMNPPFISFGAQTSEQRAQLRAATDASAARGDYSMAFVARALGALNPGGVLGTLFPASLLSLKAAESWRERIASEGQVRLLASIGDFGLFSHALVQVASAVIRKSGAEPASALTAVLTEKDPAATGEALRQVRKLGGIPPPSPIIEDRWSIFPVQTLTLAKRATWRLPTPATERLLRDLSDLSLPTVGELFHVAQGIQTGLNDVFLLLPEEWRALPPKERRYFRKATMTDSIENGQVTKPYHLFFPHTVDGPLFKEEVALVEAVPTYFRTYLAPNIQRLQTRASIVQSRRSDWWGLMRPRTWAFDKGPRVITKFFASEGGFVGDFMGEYLVVMGHVWVPQQILLDIDEDQLSSDEIVRAYVALFNSWPFVKLLSFYAPHVAGGQFDLSARHVNPIPLPDLRALSLDPVKGRQVRELARLARKIDLSDPEWSSVTAKLVMDLYGAQIVSLG
jgi:adenine-specific DNA-methyltransferase